MSRPCALITGASSGIGAATAELLADHGYDLILAARRVDRLTELAKRLQPRTRVDVIALDVRVPDALARVLSAADLARVSVLVNNAGLAKGTDKVQSGQIADWDQMLDTNVKGLLYVTRAVLPEMIKQNRGHIVNIGSIAGRYVYPGGAVYCATKFAVRALTEGLRLDVLGTPIRITNIEPGMVETEFSEVRFQDKARAMKVYEGLTPLTAADVADAIFWSLSRPGRVNVQEMVLYPTDQASPTHVHRR